jgi:hypothetical protein
MKMTKELVDKAAVQATAEMEAAQARADDETLKHSLGKPVVCGRPAYPLSYARMLVLRKVARVQEKLDGSEVGEEDSLLAAVFVLFYAGDLGALGRLASKPAKFFSAASKLADETPPAEYKAMCDYAQSKLEDMGSANKISDGRPAGEDTPEKK